MSKSAKFRILALGMLIASVVLFAAVPISAELSLRVSFLVWVLPAAALLSLGMFFRSHAGRWADHERNGEHESNQDDSY